MYSYWARYDLRQGTKCTSLNIYFLLYLPKVTKICVFNCYKIQIDLSVKHVCLYFGVLCLAFSRYLSVYMAKPFFIATDNKKDIWSSEYYMPSSAMAIDKKAIIREFTYVGCIELCSHLALLSSVLYELLLH